MYCERYRCEMGERTCIARQKRHAGVGFVSYARDPGCYQCAQGMEVMKLFENGKGEVMAETQEQYRADSVGYSVKFCRKCEKRFVRDDSLKDFFHKSKNTEDGFESTCKKCKTDRARELRQSKKKPAKKEPAKKIAKDTIQKNNHPVAKDEMVNESIKDRIETPGNVLDGMIKQVFEHAGYPKLYDELKKSAFSNMRPPHLQALFLVTQALMKREESK